MLLNANSCNCNCVVGCNLSNLHIGISLRRPQTTVTMFFQLEVMHENQESFLMTTEKYFLEFPMNDFAVFVLMETGLHSFDDEITFNFIQVCLHYNINCLPRAHDSKRNLLRNEFSIR